MCHLVISPLADLREFDKRKGYGTVSFGYSCLGPALGQLGVFLTFFCCHFLAFPSYMKIKGCAVFKVSLWRTLVVRGGAMLLSSVLGGVHLAAPVE